MTDVVLVKTRTCIYCPSASKLWHDLQKEADFNLKEVYADTPEGQELVQKFSIMAVPTTIIDGKVAFVGVPDRSRALAAVKK